MTLPNNYSNPQHGSPLDQVELYLPSVSGYEKIARGAAEALAGQMAFSREQIENLKTAVSEACLNAIEHGNNLERITTVSVLMTSIPDGLEVRITDQGLRRFPRTLPSPGSGPDQRGWGLYFIEQLMDEVEITELPEGGNLVRMMIYFKPQNNRAAKGRHSPFDSAANTFNTDDTYPRES